MNDKVITDISQITLDWLNSVLIDSKALVTGRVEDFALAKLAEGIALSGSANARIAKIQLQYKLGTTGTLPTSLFLKMCAGNDSIFGASEVNYYTRDYIHLTNPPFPTCYHAGYAENPRRYHILLEDLSASHRPNWQVKPTLAYGCAVAQALATLHAHFWGTEKLETIGASIPTEMEIERYVNHVQPGLLPMLEEVSTEIDGSWSSALMDVFQYHPAKMIERTKNLSGFTLIHGDVNPGNILSPLNKTGKTYLIDRQPFDWSLTTWLGVSDIAYMMVHWWDSDFRRQWEIPVLRKYHASLIYDGVSDYAWEQLINDYKLTAVQSLYVATQWCVLEEDRRKMKWVWFPQLQKSMTAFFDLNCSELWTY
ncbi:phosphotransferase [Desmonostoc muscorum LEGE 12446]|uniref:Phosphotransferase n=1 Tax=Desmonostoc muscorum LEGE 12446 TaxID=1828758 RepID=A0A8J6ZL52_DESMC|nr:phosphotransferase [Desmonostoc muscorum]MCF2149542.1 phosphotransferase [Desmonostoc muscorum LEGE 12446]